MEALKHLQRCQALRREELALEFYGNCVQKAAACIGADWSITPATCATLLHRGYWQQRRGTFSGLADKWLQTQPTVTSTTLRNPWPHIRACCKFTTAWAKGFQTSHYISVVNSWVEGLVSDCRQCILEKSSGMPEAVRNQVLALCGLSLDGFTMLGFWVIFVCSVAQTSAQPVPSPSLSWKSNTKSAFLWVGEGESRENSICGGGHGSTGRCNCRVLTLTVDVGASSLTLAHRYYTRTPLAILLIQMKYALPEVWQEYCQSATLYIQNCSSTLPEIERLTGQPIVPERRCDLIALTTPPPSYMASLDYTLRPPVLLLGGLNGQARDAVPSEFFHRTAAQLQEWNIDGQQFLDLKLAVHRLKWGYDVPYTTSQLTDDGLGDRQGQYRLLLRTLMTRRMTFSTYVNLKCSLGAAFQHHVICCECSHMRADELQQSGNIDVGLAVKAVPSIICRHVTPQTVRQLEEQMDLYAHELSRKKRR